MRQICANPFWSALIQHIHTFSQALWRVMRVTLRHQIRLMPEQPLNFVQVHPALYESCGEGVPHVVKPEVWNSSPISRLAEFPNQKPHLQEIAKRSLECWPS